MLGILPVNQHVASAEWTATVFSNEMGDELGNEEENDRCAQNLETVQVAMD